MSGFFKTSNQTYKLMTILGVIIIFAGLVPSLSASPLPDNKGEKMVEYEHYYVRLLGIREGWPDNMTEIEEKIMQDHFIYLQDLVSKKKVLLAGPCFEPVFGLIILQTTSEKEAIEIMKNEPSVVQGVHTYEIHSMKASLMAHNVPSYRYITDPSDKEINLDITVKASLDDVWHAWTTTDGVKTFFSSEAKVELRPGGPFEIYFMTEAPFGSRGSEDCKILSYLPKKMLSFEWNAPPDFGDLRFIKTQVILQFEQLEAESIKITLTHIGWGKSEEWDKLYNYFDKAWTYVLGNFQKRFSDGLLDFSK